MITMEWFPKCLIVILHKIRIWDHLLINSQCIVLGFGFFFPIDRIYIFWEFPLSLIILKSPLIEWLFRLLPNLRLVDLGVFVLKEEHINDETAI